MLKILFGQWSTQLWVDTVTNIRALTSNKSGLSFKHTISIPELMLLKTKRKKKKTADLDTGRETSTHFAASISQQPQSCDRHYAFESRPVESVFYFTVY